MFLPLISEVQIYSPNPLNHKFYSNYREITKQHASTA